LHFGAGNWEYVAETALGLERRMRLETETERPVQSDVSLCVCKPGYIQLLRNRSPDADVKQWTHKSLLRALSTFLH
jgi:hypothetical protein